MKYIFVLLLFILNACSPIKLDTINLDSLVVTANLNLDIANKDTEIELVGYEPLFVINSAEQRKKYITLNLASIVPTIGRNGKIQLTKLDELKAYAEPVRAILINEMQSFGYDSMTVLCFTWRDGGVEYKSYALHCEDGSIYDNIASHISFPLTETKGYDDDFRTDVYNSKKTITQYTPIICEKKTKFIHSDIFGQYVYEFNYKHICHGRYIMDNEIAIDYSTVDSEITVKKGNLIKHTINNMGLQTKNKYSKYSVSYSVNLPTLNILYIQDTITSIDTFYSISQTRSLMISDDRSNWKLKFKS